MLPNLYILRDNDTRRIVTSANRSNAYYESLAQAKNARTQLRRGRDLRILRLTLSGPVELDD